LPRQRSKENRGLPARWQFTHGAFYYRVPPGLEPWWNGQTRFRLGTNIVEAHRTFVEHVGNEPTMPGPKAARERTAGHLLDRYALEVVPAKGSPLTRADNLRAVKLLKKRFGDVPLGYSKWPMLFYQYASNRKKPDGTKALTAAHRELEVMSHAFTKAVQWGLIARHPTLNEVRFDGDLALKARTRYIEDWEVLECLALPARRAQGSVLAIQAYIRLKLLTGLARSDLLRLRVDQHIKEDGIHVERHKTGKATVYEWTPERRAAVEDCKRTRPALSPFLFCDRRGAGYIMEDTGTCHGWDSMWSRFMDRVLLETKVTERFHEHDLRAKAGSDAESLEKARALLQHADARTTRRFYMRKPERV
jgi:integrase